MCKHFYTTAPHLNSEPGCLEGSTWLRKGQAAPLAGYQKEKEVYCIYSATISGILCYTADTHTHTHNRAEILTWAVFT